MIAALPCNVVRPSHLLDQRQSIVPQLHQSAVGAAQIADVEGRLPEFLPRLAFGRLDRKAAIIEGPLHAPLRGLAPSKFSGLDCVLHRLDRLDHVLRVRLARLANGFLIFGLDVRNGLRRVLLHDSVLHRSLARVSHLIRVPPHRCERRLGRFWRRLHGVHPLAALVGELAADLAEELDRLLDLERIEHRIR